MPIDLKTNLPTPYDSQTDTKEDGTNTSGVLPQAALAPLTTVPATQTDKASGVAGIAHTKVDKLSASNVALVATATAGMTSSIPELPFLAVTKQERAEAAVAVNLVVGDGQTRPSSTLAALDTVKQALSGETSAPLLDSSGKLNTMRAYDILQKTGFKSEQVDMVMNNAANKNVMDQQMMQAKVLKDQIQGEKKSAVAKLVGSFLGATAGLGSGFMGQKLRESGGKDSTAKAAEQNNAAAIQSVQKNSQQTAQLATRDAKMSSRKNSIFGDGSKPDGTIPADSAHDAAVRKNDGDKAAVKAADRQSASSGVAPANGTRGGKAADPHGGIFAKENRAAQGAALDSAGQAVAQVPGAIVDLMDKVYGGAHEADVAKIQNKQLDASITASKSVQDNTKNAKDKSAKMLDDAFATLKAHFDLEKSTTDNIANK